MGQPNPTENYIHTPSDFRFPPTVAGFARETVKQYDREGRDVSVGYNQGQSIAMTVYVYPIPAEGPDSSLESHFQKCKSEVLSRHQGVELLSDGPVTASPGGQQRTGRHAAFKYNERFAQRQQDVHAELYVFVNGSWFIKYRVTCPAGQKGAVEPAIKAFIEALNWPIGRQGSRRTRRSSSMRAEAAPRNANGARCDRICLRPADVLPQGLILRQGRGH